MPLTAPSRDTVKHLQHSIAIDPRDFTVIGVICPFSISLLPRTSFLHSSGRARRVLLFTRASPAGESDHPRKPTILTDPSTKPVSTLNIVISPITRERLTSSTCANESTSLNDARCVRVRKIRIYRSAYRAYSGSTGRVARQSSSDQVRIEHRDRSCRSRTSVVVASYVSHESSSVSLFGRTGEIGQFRDYGNLDAPERERERERQ